MKVRIKRSNLTLSTHNRKKITRQALCNSMAKFNQRSSRPVGDIPHPQIAIMYNHSEDNKLQKEKRINVALHELISEALQALQIEGLNTTFLDFFRLIRQGNFPVDNIALSLFADAVRWYKCRSSTEMRYSRQSKLFWKLGYRLFGRRFINYMRGAKNEGQVVLNQSTKGQYSPLSSKINFAGPSLGQLTQFDPYDLQSSIKSNCSRPFAPGLLEDMISTLGCKVNGISCCLTFEGKKIKQGLTPDGGDVDLFGFESKDSLYEKRQKLTCLIEPFRDLLDTTCDTNGSDEISVLSIDEQEDVKKNLKSDLRTLSEDILEVQEARKIQSVYRRTG